MAEGLLSGLLGGGGSGVAYKAVAVKPYRFVGLKFLPDEISKDALALARFQREGQAASALSDPNICTIYNIGKSGEQLFIAMVGGSIKMKKIWMLGHHRIVWTIGAALLAIVAVPAIVGLVLKALGLLHGASLHSWLLDVGHNVDGEGAIGGAIAGAVGAAIGGLGAAAEAEQSFKPGRVGDAGMVGSKNSYPDPEDNADNYPDYETAPMAPAASGTAGRPFT